MSSWVTGAEARLGVDKESGRWEMKKAIRDNSLQKFTSRGKGNMRTIAGEGWFGIFFLMDKTSVLEG